jgi:catechol 2,3-dioxygenase-like lactoylglutathione lyase family enzyme
MVNPGSGSAAVRWTGVCLDCADAEALAAFYARLLGWEVTARDDATDRNGGAGWVALANPAGGVGLSFQAEDWYEPPVWPEQPDEQGKMLHLEVEVDDLAAAVALVLDAGGRVAPEQPSDRDPNELRVMLDPAGHPFCLFRGETPHTPGPAT